MEEAAAAAEGVPVPDARTAVEPSTRYGGMSIRQCIDRINKSLKLSFLFNQIRANHLSGDCHYKRELLRGFMKIRGHEQ
ncbi:hypothetical protein BHE74_00033401, partial [Ensete ventricosum]